MQLIFALIGQSGGVAYFAHIGGFIVGLASAYGWKFFSNYLSGRRAYQSPYHRPRSIKSSRSALNNQYDSGNRLKSSDVNHLEKTLHPEIITGENFVDIIFEDKNASTYSQIQANFDNETRLLSIRNLVTNKSDTLPISHLQNRKYVVSNVSVINGIVRIRLS
jgi:hypothetical protein